jgi:RHS repeat-associated protein
MKKLKLLLLNLLLIGVSQIMAVKYTPSPSGWTGKPSSDLKESSTTWIAATSSGEYIQMKAVDNGDGTVTFYAKKSTGNSFINSVTFRVYKDPSISGSSLNDHGKAIGQGKATAGDYEMSFTMTPDFDSGSHTYIALVVSNGNSVTRFCTKTIKLTAEDEDDGPSAPNVTTRDASDVTSNSATLRGSITPNGASTDYAFFWGTDRNDPENHTTARELSGSYSAETVTEQLTGLSPNTTYYYFLFAVNSEGGNKGDIKSFTTEAGSNPDTGDGMTFEQAADYLESKGVIEYRNLDNDLLRQQLAKIAFRGLYSINGRSVGSVPSDNYPSVYQDLIENEDKYYFQAAHALLYLEYGDGITPFDRNRLQFNPEKEIARLDVLKVLMETFNIKPNSNLTNPFPDDATVSNMKRNGNPRYGYIAQAAELGIILKPNGGKNTSFRAYDLCTRGEAFIMLARIMKKIENGDINDPDPRDADYFQPLNVTLKTISLGLSLPMGNFQHYTKTSFSLNGTVPLLFAHAYNSYNTTLPSAFYGAKEINDIEETYQPLGDGWSHSYHTFLTYVGDDSEKRAIVHWGGGKMDVYKKSGNRMTPESIGVYDEFTSEGSDVVIKTKSQFIYRFSDLSSSGADVLYLTSITDRNGNKMTINYETGENGSKRIRSVSDGNRSLTFSYVSGTNLVSTVEDPLGRSVSFSYFDNDLTGKKQLRSFKDAEGNKTQYAYTEDSKISSSKLLTNIKMPKGNVIKNEYYENLRLKKSMAFESGVPRTQTSVEVTANYGGSVSTDSHIEVERDSRYSYYDYKFNGDNSVKRLSGADDYLVQANYGNPLHPQLPTSMRSNSSNVNPIEYDEYGNITSITVKAIDGSGSLTTTMTYDSMNNLTSVIDPNRNKTTYNYDSNGNLIEVSAPEGVSTSFSVNSKGLVTTATNPMGVKTNFDYNRYGNLTKTTLPALSLSSSAEYDDASRLISITDALGRTRQFAYYNNDLLKREVDPEGHRTSYDYDANGNLTSITNAKGGVTSLYYDNVTDWLTSVEFDGATKQYEYNKDGSLSSYTKPDGTTLDYSYDDLGRVTNDGVNSYSYDNKLRLSSISGNGKTLSFSYDGYNRITGTDCDGHSNSYEYDANGNCIGINNTTYGYDKLNRLTSVKFNGKTITYSYRKDSQLSEVSYPNGMTTSYGYDEVGRLTSKSTKLSNGTVIASYNYTLDKVGNITEQLTKEPYGDIILTNEDVEYSYNSGNRITKAGDISFSFDENGNTTKRGDEKYRWDESDRLIRAGSTSIEYDPLGLIASFGDITFTTDPLGMGNVLSDSKSGAEYIYGIGLEARIKNGKVSYYVTDVRGSVVAIVDESGNITHKYQYDEFGKVTQKEEADYNPFQYVGKYGVMYLSDHQYYMRARHYDPTIGRFFSEDPIWSTNLYPYVDNNPISSIDPKGEMSEGVQLVGMQLWETAGSIGEGLSNMPSLGRMWLTEIVPELITEWSIDYVSDSKKINELLLQEAQERAAKSDEFKDWAKVYYYEGSLGFNDIWINDYYRNAFLFCLYSYGGLKFGGMSSTTAAKFGLKKSVKPLVKKKTKDFLKSKISKD